MPQVRHLKLPIGILRPYVSLLRPQLRLLKAFSQPSIASHPLLQAGRTKVPLCSTGLCPLQGRCPASSHSNSQSCKGIADHILPLGNLLGSGFKGGKVQQNKRGLNSIVCPTFIHMAVYPPYQASQSSNPPS